MLEIDNIVRTITEHSGFIGKQSNTILKSIEILCEQIPILVQLFNDDTSSGIQEKIDAIRNAIEQIREFADLAPEIINELNNGAQPLRNRNGLSVELNQLMNTSARLRGIEETVATQVNIINHNIQLMHSILIDSYLCDINRYVKQVDEFRVRLNHAGAYFAHVFQACMECDESITSSFYDVDSSDKSPKTEAPKLSEVQFSAIIPKQAQKGEYLLFSIYMYEESFRSVIDEALIAEVETKEHKSGFYCVEDNTFVKVVLKSNELDETETETSLWKGKYLRFDFAPSIPENFSKKQLLFTASIYFNDILTTNLKFDISVGDDRLTILKISRKDILSAFVSYASQDRGRVATIIQGMKKVRPDLDIFFDVESLRSGEKWEDILRKEIDERDVLYLFWSHFARESEWVDMEWKYALERKGIDCIEPVPIEPPEKCPPPKELSAKHFNDRELLYYQNPQNDIL